MKVRHFLHRPKKWMRVIVSNGVRWIYYKNCYAKNILRTKPIVCDPEVPFEVHTLTCEKDLLNTLWSLKTFYHFSKVRPRLVIYEDGSLSMQSISILSEHFLNCMVIRRDRFHHDMEDFLKAYKSCLAYSRITSFYCALKLFGPMYYTKSERLLYVDSDVLFFKEPSELLYYVDNGTPFYMSDYQDAYFQPVEYFKDLLNVDLAHKVNAGLFHVAKRDLVSNMEIVESYFNNISGIGDNGWKVNRHEQTLVAMLLSKANALRLSSDYQISKKSVTDKTISHHFVNDGSRPGFYGAGLRHLRMNGFVDAL